MTFVESPDFEAPADDGGDNVYDITITASDGTAETSQDVTITVTDEDDPTEAPEFTSDTTATVDENTATPVYTATATDADTETDDLTFSLGTRGDSGLFSIDPDTGALSFNAPPDHEAPNDDGGDNIYDVEIIVSDGTNETAQVVQIAVNDVADEDPEFTSSTTTTMDENETETGYTPAATPDLAADTVSYFTGDLDIHDMARNKDGDPVFINTLFNCLAKADPKHSFEPIWQPPFISGWVAEDRCHLNGLALRDGEPRYVTMVSQTDVYDGWRSHRESGGVVMDIQSNDVICDGLSMPHSPRWHDGRLWLHNSGTGDFGYVDPKKKAFVPLTFCPGYLRGLDFIGGHAVVGLSLPRDNKTFTGLALDDRLREQDVSPRSGLYFIDLESGAIAHALVFEGIVSELYDVAVLPGVRKPGAIGPLGDEIKTVLSIQDPNRAAA